MALDSRWYLVAYDCSREDWRTFRIDRMNEPVPARNTFVPRPAPASDLYEYVRFAMRALDTLHRVVLDVDVPGDRVRDEYGTWVDVDDLADGRCRVTMDADSFRWPTHIVANLDAPFTVIGPPAFRQHLVSVARQLDESTRDGEAVMRRRPSRRRS